MNNDILARYEQAKTILKGLMPGRVVLNDAVFSHWIENSPCFWYVKETQTGKEYHLVDAEAGSNKLAFEHSLLADALTKATGQTVDPQNLPIEGKDATITLSPLQFHFTAFGKKWLFESDGTLSQKAEQESQDAEEDGAPKFITLPYSAKQPLCSPDGKKDIFTRDHNVWIKNRATGEERALTKDGTANYRYACDLFEYDTVMQALWSPDSSRIFTVCLDTREAASRPFPAYVPEDGSLNMQMTPFKLAFSGNENIENYHLVVIDVNNGEVNNIDYLPIPLIACGEPTLGFFRAGLGWWSSDSRRAFFVDITRGSKTVRVVELDTYTRTTRVLFEETTDTFVNLRHSIFDKPLFLSLPESDELIWFSERTDWGHLYLYDLNTGKLKHPITEGEWLVRDILHYDATRRELLLQTTARDPNISPYYRDICKVNIDTGVMTTLASGCFDYSVYTSSTVVVAEFEALGVDRFDVDGVSPCGQYIVTTRSRVDTVPVSVLIDKNGREILELETADISGLPSYWEWPEPVKLKAADNKTDIYGVVYRPPGFSSDEHYPVLEYSVSARCFSALPQGSFFNTPQAGGDYLIMAALAALGFIVVQIEGRGLPLRNKAFQDHHYGDLAFASDFNDRIAGIRQLAKQYPYMDLERVGITGIEGMPNTVYGPLKHSDFYKVGMALHTYDPRFSAAMVGETYDGTADKAMLSKMTFPEDYVESFNGKLLLIFGMLASFTPAGSFRLIEALQNANKSFDTLCLPNLKTHFTSYTLRREWDYLVTHLQGIEPPKDFHLTTGRDKIYAWLEGQDI